MAYTVYGNTYQYYAAISEDEYRRGTLKGVVKKYFNNSYTQVVSTLIEEETISVEELKELINRIEKKKQNEYVLDLYGKIIALFTVILCIFQSFIEPGYFFSF